MKYFWFYIILFLIYGCDNSIKIIDKPILFNEKRIQLTQEYLIYTLQLRARQSNDYT